MSLLSSEVIRGHLRASLNVLSDFPVSKNSRGNGCGVRKFRFGRERPTPRWSSSITSRLRAVSETPHVVRNVAMPCQRNLDHRRDKRSDTWLVRGAFQTDENKSIRFEFNLLPSRERSKSGSPSRAVRQLPVSSAQTRSRPRAGLAALPTLVPALRSRAIQ